MAVVAPFKGFTYNFWVRQDFANLVAPPYDVISEEEQEGYYQADPYNVIRLILGKKKTGDCDWDNRYTRAADDFKRWLSSGILIGTQQPCIYVTSLTYDPGNGRAKRTRWGIIALVRIEDEESGVILPHERTFSAHRDDRLKLMRACHAQFSQIFGLYEDPDDTVLDACRETMEGRPQVAFDFNDGTSHQMWILSHPFLFKKIRQAMSPKSIFIADGHHRYETARNYRNMMRARYGRKPANRAYEFVMMYLSNMSDEGMTILPSHRLIKRIVDFQPDVFLDTLSPWFEIEVMDHPNLDPAQGAAFVKERLEQAGRRNSAIAFCGHQAAQWHLLTLKEDVRDQMGEDLHPSLKKLDVLVLSRFILQKALGFTKADLDNEEIIHYESSIEKSLMQVQNGQHQMAFLLNPTKMEHVKEIAGNRLVMPRKSTYFYPKILTGLVFNKIDPHEIIQFH
jgi:uncharacterized protein (DUF1015 family)